MAFAPPFEWWLTDCLTDGLPDYKHVCSCCLDSNVTMIAQNQWFLYIGVVASRRVCVCSLHIWLVLGTLNGHHVKCLNFRVFGSEKKICNTFPKSAQSLIQSSVCNVCVFVSHPHPVRGGQWHFVICKGKGLVSTAAWGVNETGPSSARYIYWPFFLLMTTS